MNPTSSSDNLFEDDGEICFAEEGEDTHKYSAEPWRVVIVDDEPEVHAVTRLALSDFAFLGRKIEFLSAYSGMEARELLGKASDIALIFLDVVMETDDAGLQLVRYIRDVLQNHSVRIILRTGQPGMAPEEQVITNYDINDYKSKTELTHQKIFSCTVAALRSYNTIVALEASRNGLGKIVNASEDLFRARSMQLFCSGVLTQLGAMVGLGYGGILTIQFSDEAGRDAVVFAGSGPYEHLMGQPLSRLEDEQIRAAIEATLSTKNNTFCEDYATLYITTHNGRKIVTYLPTPKGEQLSETDQSLVNILCTKISIGFDNLTQLEQLKAAQKATVVALAQVAELHGTDTGGHLLRISKLCEDITLFLKEKASFPDELTDFVSEQIGMAAILHDIGKILSSDTANNSESDDSITIKQHTTDGAALLKRADAMIDGLTYVRLGRDIAQFHHEYFDGTGYPDGLSSTAIPLSARIVAVADAFDELTHRPPQTEPWPLDKAIDYIRAQAGRRFDPLIVAAFLSIIARPGYAERLQAISTTHHADLASR
ncbi:MAG: DUF3369 domain-containing protein [Rhodospirillaceae bacterium]